MLDKGKGVTEPEIGKVLAYVSPPFMLSIGITFQRKYFSVLYTSCKLSNCISFNSAEGVFPVQTVRIHHHPSFVMLLVDISESWYNDKGLIVLEEINKASSSQNRVIELVTLGVIALISLLDTASTIAVALSQTIQNSHYVNELTKKCYYDLRYSGRY